MAKHVNGHTKPEESGPKLYNWLCQEFDEEFVVAAYDREGADAHAALYGGKVIRQITSDDE